MPPRIDLTNQKFGKLTVTEYAETKNGKAYWFCLCECGNTNKVYASDLTSGNTKSCGCLKPIHTDLTGRKFFHLTVVKVAGKNKDNEFLWSCKCDCGKMTILRSSVLRQGHTKSCGCLRKSNATKLFTIHKQSNNKTYKSWAHAKSRCTNPDDPSYPEYGGRGISLCEKWLTFQGFYEDMGDAPKGKTLDRYPDQNGNYELTNCRWATPKEQNRNKRSNIFITYLGRTELLIDWAIIVNIPYSTLWRRYKVGWSSEDILTKPLAETRPRKRKK